jgi:uncharacterized protein YbjT (DUF2867 family)
VIPDNSDEAPMLILCGTGKTGRRLVERLTARGRAMRVGSRSAAPPFDVEDRSTVFMSTLAARSVPQEAEDAPETAATGIWDVPALAGVL